MQLSPLSQSSRVAHAVRSSKPTLGSSAVGKCGSPPPGKLPCSPIWWPWQSSLTDEGRDGPWREVGLPQAKSTKAHFWLGQVAQALEAIPGSMAAIVKGGREDCDSILPSLSLSMSPLTQQCCPPPPAPWLFPALRTAAARTVYPVAGSLLCCLVVSVLLH